jgi:hypothetical protein
LVTFIDEACGHVRSPYQELAILFCPSEKSNSLLVGWINL